MINKNFIKSLFKSDNYYFSGIQTTTVLSTDKIQVSWFIIKPSLKPVNQYDLQLNLIKTWPTRKEAQQAYPNWRIGACLNGKKKTCNGYIFKYADDNNLEVPIHKGREIIIDGVKYKSIKHASEILNISQYKLRKKLC